MFEQCLYIFSGCIEQVAHLGALGGVISDRYSSHRVAVWTQSAALLQAIVLAVLTLADWVAPIHIILLGFILGIINAFDMPARQALVHNLVAVEDLPNAVALNSSMINAARIIGPGVAGIVVALAVWLSPFGNIAILCAGAYLALVIARRVFGRQFRKSNHAWMDLRGSIEER